MACRALSKEASIGNVGGIKWTIRPMRKEDVDKTLLIWSKVELTEAKQTVLSALAADPLGFYVAELNETGEVIGMCAGPMTRTDTAFMGFYGVEPDYQGIGIGRELWARTLGRLEPTVNVGLYGVPSMSEKYKKSGFTIEDSTRMLIFESKSHAEHELNLSALKDTDELDSNCRIEVLDGCEQSELVLEKLIDYDHSVQRFSREKLLRIYLRGNDVPLTLVIVKDLSQGQSKTNASFNEPQQHGHISATDRRSSCCAKPNQESIIEDETLSTTTKSSLSLSTTAAGADQCCSEAPFRSNSPIDIPAIVSSTTTTTTSNEPSGADSANLTSTRAASSTTTTTPATVFEVLGYGCIRHDNNGGGMIGPIYADSSELCEILLRNLISRFELETGQIYSVMALSSNKQACKILTKLGLIEMEQCSRMFTKFVPAASFSKIYYVHSPNFTLF